MEQLVADIAFDQPVGPAILIGLGVHFLFMVTIHIAGMAQPFPQRPCGRRPGQCRLDTATAVMSADNDAVDHQHTDGEIDHRHQVAVLGLHQIGDVAVDEQPAGQRLGELVGRYPAVGTADPQEHRFLVGDMARKEIRVLDKLLRRPGAVVEH